MWLVTQGLARWLTRRAIHQKPQTYAAESRIDGSLPAM